MKTLHAQYQNTLSHELVKGLSDLLNNLIVTPMKKLTNVSPFLLLLAPVMIMMVLTFSINKGAQEESAMKSSGKTSTAVVKIADKLL